VSADTVVPGAGNPQALNRYAFVLNNPVKYTDPTGHFAWVPVLALAGAAVGAGIYIGTSLASGRTMNVADGLIAAGVGAAGGALIGTGIGFGAGIGMFAAIGAGTGVLSGQVGYSLTAGTDYNSTEMAVTAGINGVAGAVSGAVGAPMSPLTPGAAAVAQIGISAAAGAGQYAATETLRGRGDQLRPETVGAAAAVAAVTGYLDVKLAPSLVSNHLLSATGMRNPLNSAFYRALGAEVAISTIRPALVGAMSQQPSNTFIETMDDLVPDR